MKALWQQYLGKFEALSFRERGLVAAGLLLFVALVGYLVLIEPQLVQAKNLKRQIQRANVDLHNAREQVAALRSQSSDPDQALRAQVAGTLNQLKEIEARLHNLQAALVPPNQMAGLLEEILKRNRRLQLVSLRSLPALPLLTAKDGGGKDDRGNSFTEGNVYRHGVELVISGAYADLTSYLGELEKMPQKVFWHSVKLDSEDYPRATLRFTVYTLSFEKAWLTV